MFDKNEAIKAYSAAMGNRLRDLQDYCRTVDFSGDVDALAASIRQIQERAFDLIWRHSERQPLSGQEIEKLTREHLAQQEPWLNDVGMDGILQWVAWMSWHEGCMMRESVTQRSRWWEFWK